MSKTIYKGLIKTELLNLYIRRLYNGIPYGIKANLGGKTQLTVTIYGIAIYNEEQELLNNKNGTFGDEKQTRQSNGISEFGRLICSANDSTYPLVSSYINLDGEVINDIVKPYLRPLSSMTYAEETVFHLIPKNEYVQDIGGEKLIIPRYINWLNEHHFDYSGLIEKGLALEAPNDLY